MPNTSYRMKFFISKTNNIFIVSQILIQVIQFTVHVSATPVAFIIITLMRLVLTVFWRRFQCCQLICKYVFIGLFYLAFESILLGTNDISSFPHPINDSYTWPVISDLLAVVSESFLLALVITLPLSLCSLYTPTWCWTSCPFYLCSTIYSSRKESNKLDPVVGET